MKQVTITITFEADDANIDDVLKCLKDGDNHEIENFRDIIDDVANSAFVQVESLTDDFGVPYQKAKLNVQVKK